MGEESADHAAALGVSGLVPNHSLNARQPPPRFDLAWYLVPLSSLLRQLCLWCVGISPWAQTESSTHTVTAGILPCMANVSTCPSTRSSLPSSSGCEEHNIWNPVLGLLLPLPRVAVH